ncbi:MAG: hypothetical protein ACOYNB_08705 [Aquabacterium sp.]|uniref:hypothetical protein n=1 Tax=Aquabacterium sp. TaxID=1872578 RepID=UPI003BC18F01
MIRALREQCDTFAENVIALSAIRVFRELNCTPMSSTRLNGQSLVRAFAFGDQVHLQATEGASCGVAAGVSARPGRHQSEAVELHQRADLMFKQGFTASGWALRNRAWRMEGQA